MNTERMDKCNTWQSIDWKTVERQVFKLQKRIYRASQNGNVKLVHKLQRLLTHSYYGKVLATRRVTQDNQGKKTAGVDGVKSLTPKQRLEMVNNLKLGKKVKPSRRVWIPKPNTEEKRPLGIPTIYERTLQALVKLTLEPQWEAHFENNSYGFRPARNSHDAIDAIFLTIKHKAKYVLDADIAKCFEKINHDKLLDKLLTYPTLRKQIKNWKECQVIIQNWLNELGLELKPSKTKISHTLKKINGNVGFDFLGFTIRQHPTGKHHSGKNTIGKLLGFKTIIKPSKEKIQTHLKKIGDVIRKHKSSPQITLIKELNPIIRGWSNYYSTVISKEEYSYCDFIMYQQLKRWAERRHPQKSKTWVNNKYWHTRGNRNWCFSTREGDNGYILRTHAETPIVRHVKVKGEKSLYDGDLTYWSSRLGKHPEVSKEKATLLKKQKGKCTYCNLFFKDGDLMETDHIIPKTLGGDNSIKNEQLLHRHCHDDKTALDGSLNRIYDKDSQGEKPCEVKVSRTVLKTSLNREV